VILCYNKLTGKELWRKTVHKGIPRATRHVKATHSNTTVAVDGKNVVAFFGSEGLYCYDFDGNLKWKHDLGVIDVSWYGVGWGYSSSPVIYEDRIAITCDDPNNPYFAVVRLSDGEEIWRVNRKDVSGGSWATPLIYQGPKKRQAVVNGWPWIVSYDLETGDVLWKIRDGGDIPIPSPFVANGNIYITSSHGKKSPIYVVRPEARGDITPTKKSQAKPSTLKDAMVWSTFKGGSYMSTPVVYKNNIYLGSSSVIRCFDATTGKKNYTERLGSFISIIASLVAADDKIYCTSEDGTIIVLAAGDEFKILSKNPMGEPCFATPAISQGVLYFRTTKSLVAIK
jgi:outer membrane protein assembly factor BamB